MPPDATTVQVTPDGELLEVHSVESDPVPPAAVPQPGAGVPPPQAPAMTIPVTVAPPAPAEPVAPALAVQATATVQTPAPALSAQPAVAAQPVAAPQQPKGTTPAAQLAPLAPKLPTAKPLSDLVSPFKVGEPAKPAVEYVPVNVTLQIPVSAAAQALGQSAPQPIIQANPVLQSPAPQPVISAPLVPQSPPVEARPIPPPAFQSKPDPQPQPAPTDGKDKAVRIYSHNTRAVWRARRLARAWYISSSIAVALLALGGAAYWFSLGSPTLSNAPVIQDLLSK